MEKPYEILDQRLHDGNQKNICYYGSVSLKHFDEENDDDQCGCFFHLVLCCQDILHLFLAILPLHSQNDYDYQECNFECFILALCSHRVQIPQIQSYF